MHRRSSSELACRFRRPLAGLRAAPTPPRDAAGAGRATAGFPPEPDSPSASGRPSRKSGSISAYLESQSFFRSYGSILPTSLVCIVRYRPEATRLGDLLRSIGTRSHEIQLHLPGFSRDGREAPDDAQHGRRFSAAPSTASPLDAIPRSTYFWRPYQEKIALPGLRGHRLRGCLRHRQAPRPAVADGRAGKSPCRGSGIDARFPFGRPGTRARDKVALAVPAVSRRSPPPSGAATPRSIDVRVEPFSTSAFEGFA